MVNPAIVSAWAALAVPSTVTLPLTELITALFAPATAVAVSLTLMLKIVDPPFAPTIVAASITFAVSVTVTFTASLAALACAAKFPAASLTL